MIGIQAKDYALSLADCQYLIDYIKNVEEADEWSPVLHEMWEKRTIDAHHIADPDAVEVIKKLYRIIKNFLPDGYDADAFRLVVAREGDSHPLHSDDIVAWREFSSITYLNDDFVGGHTIFPKQGVDITPKAGLTIVFEGNSRYPHEVSEVVSGVRYTIASFWTKVDQFKLYKGWDDVIDN